MKKNFYLIYPFFITAFIAILFSAQSLQAQNIKWQANNETGKVFIENLSQFDGRNHLPGSKVLFATDDDPAQIFFTNNGLTYRLETREHRKVNERKEKERGKKGLVERERAERALLIKTDLVQMQWENSNPNAEVIGTEATPDYHCYGKVFGAKGFKKLVYKNLYPNIDVEYMFHPQEGIKYSLILHPGADVSQVKMQYSDVSKIFTDEKGNIHLPTLFGDIIDHAPITTYESADNAIIPSKFIQSGKTISFYLGNYDKTQTVIIDPWSVNPNMPNSNHAFQIESDSSGNAYVYGGDSPYRLRKYNNAGALQWTYTNGWDSSTVWCGTLATEPGGTCYVTAGSSAQIARVTNAGAQVWLTGGGIFDEYWGLAFNCDYTKLLCGGTRLTGIPSPNGSGRAFDINMGNGNVNSSVQVSWAIPSFIFNDPNEIRALAASPNGNYYFLTLDTIGSMTGTLGINYEALSGYRFAYGSPSYGFTPQPQNIIRATANFIYTCNGDSVFKRDINTGNIVAAKPIPGGSHQTALFVPGTLPDNGGIAIDSCGNVYVGSTSQVHKFDGNLNLISSAATPSAVYDVAVCTNGEILACGNGFALDVNMSACGQVKSICVTSFQATTTQANPPCFGQCNGTATANPTNGTGPYTYSWSTGETTQTISNLCANTYTVTITDQGTTNTVITSVTITAANPAITLAPSGTNTSCGNNNGSATVNITAGNGPFGYAWSSGDLTQTTASNLSAGSYTVTVTGAGGCTATASATVAASSPLAVTPSTVPASCGNNNGSATATPTTGTSPYSYLWSTGGTTSTISNLAGGTYNYTVNDASGCSITGSAIVISSGGLVINLGNDTSVCLPDTLTLNATLAGSTYVWGNGATTATILAYQTSEYFVTVTNGGCTGIDSIHVTENPKPPASVSANQSVFCSGDSAQICGNAGMISYLWNTGETTMCITTQLAGNYYVTLTDANGCSAASNHLSINVLPPPPVSVSVNGDTLTAYNASTYQWYLNGNPIPGATQQSYIATMGGSYTVMVTDTNGCPATSTAVVINGINVVTMREEIEVYPNPLESGSWHLEVGNDLLRATIEIFDDNGRLVFKSEIRNQKSEISINAASGIYMMRIVSEHNYFTKKLIRL